MSWDDFVYALVAAVVLAAIAWLLFVPAAGHAPLIPLIHTTEVR